MSQSLQQNHTLFTITLFAPSQHLIYAAFNIYTFCKNTYKDINLEYRWEDWKDILKESKNIENINAKNNALATVIAMNMAEQYYTSCQICLNKISKVSQNKIVILIGRL